MKISTSPLTNKIYCGTVNKTETKWVGKKTDVTDMAVGAVFEWFMNQMNGNQEFEIRYSSINGYVLKMVREESEETSCN